MKMLQGLKNRNSKNAFIDEYREISGRAYTHPNKRALLNT
jgi:hypothetical protein